jgi:alpha-tubulin suppressor-like RCC1 family protein
VPRAAPFPIPVPGLTEVTEISAGLGYDLALCSDGTVWAWGGNPFGQLGAGNTTTIPNSTPIHVRLLEAEVSTRDKNVFTTTQAIIAYF